MAFVKAIVHPIEGRHYYYTTITNLHSPVHNQPVIIAPVQPKIRRSTIDIPDPGKCHPVIRPIDKDYVIAFQDYQLLFASQRSETKEQQLRVVEGAIPRDFPSGTYYLNGPGIIKDDHGSTIHPLDGHGYLRGLAFDSTTGEIKYSARYIRTEAEAEEHDGSTGQWRFTHRGPFSVLKFGKKVGNTKVMKNVANTTVVRWGQQLLCFWEGGVPFEIESRTLDTIGKFKGVSECLSIEEKRKCDPWDVAAWMLRPLLYGIFRMPSKRLLSHYKIDPRTNRLLLVSCNAEDMLLARSCFTLYEFDSKFKLVTRKEFIIHDHLMIHDWAFTDSYYILFGNRVKLDIAGSMGAVCGVAPMISALSVNTSKPTTPVYLLPRSSNCNDKERDWRVPIEIPSQLWLLHVGNAFQERNENGNVDIRIQASMCSYRWFSFQKMFGYDWKSGTLDPSAMNAREGEQKRLPHLVEVCINLDANGNRQSCRLEALNQWEKPSDFPVINPAYAGKKNRYLYAAAASGSRSTIPHFPFDSVVRLNTENRSTSTWRAGNRRFIGEPIFVRGGPEEDDGYILVVEYAVAVRRCYLVILNPKQIGQADAPVARIEVPTHLSFPMGFHGFWAADEPNSSPIGS